MPASLWKQLGIQEPGPDEVFTSDCCGRVYRYADGPGWVDQACRNGCCVEWLCPDCGAWEGSAGPVGCRCELGGPNPLRIDGSSYRRRARKRQPRDEGRRR